MLKKLFIYIFTVFTIAGMHANAQKQTIDKIAAIVANYPVYESEIQGTALYIKQTNHSVSLAKAKCIAFEQAILQKFLYYQSQVDSIQVNDSQIEASMDNSVRNNIMRAGSREKLEEFLGKTVEQYKADNKKAFREQMYGQREREKVVELVNITPNEVNAFFDTLKAESIPEIPTIYEVAQITKAPVLGASQQKEARAKLNNMKERIKKGEKFETLAVLYSEDPGSAPKGGETGYFEKGVMAPEFESAAFGMKNPQELSEVIKTKFGYHLIQLIDKKNKSVNVRHILIIPKVSREDLAQASHVLDSVAQLLKDKKITFEEALKFSDDPGKVNGGLVESENPENLGNYALTANDINPKVFFEIDKLQVKEFTSPLPFQTKDNTEGYRILYLKKRIAAHKANLKEDYDQIQKWAKQSKSQIVLDKWVNERAKNTYIKINDEYKNCSFSHKWVFANK